jgi:hypothetical protein
VFRYIFSTRFECSFHIFPTRFECSLHIFHTRLECSFHIFSTRFECSFFRVECLSFCENFDKRRDSPCFSIFEYFVRSLDFDETTLETSGEDAPKTTLETSEEDAPKTTLETSGEDAPETALETGEEDYSIINNFLKIIHNCCDSQHKRTISKEVYNSLW